MRMVELQVGGGGGGAAVVISGAVVVGCGAGSGVGRGSGEPGGGVAHAAPARGSHIKKFRIGGRQRMMLVDNLVS